MMRIPPQRVGQCALVEHMQPDFGGRMEDSVVRMPMKNGCRLTRDRVAYANRQPPTLGQQSGHCLKASCELIWRQEH